MNKTLIIGGGNFPKNIDIIQFSKGYDNIIAVDRGYELLLKDNIRPNYLLGDFDSIKKNITIDSNIEIIKYPSEKSMTDMELAIEKSIELKSSFVVILGGTGSRLDHTFINVLLLKKLLENNIEGKIIDDNNEALLIDGNKKIEKCDFKYLSIVPLFNNTIISIRGVKYPLNNKKVSYGSSLCISNEITDSFSEIYTSNYSVVFKSKD